MISVTCISRGVSYLCLFDAHYLDNPLARLQTDHWVPDVNREVAPMNGCLVGNLSQVISRKNDPRGPKGVVFLVVIQFVTQLKNPWSCHQHPTGFQPFGSAFWKSTTSFPIGSPRSRTSGDPCSAGSFATLSGALPKIPWVWGGEWQWQWPWAMVLQTVWRDPIFWPIQIGDDECGNKLGLLGHHTQIYSEDYVEVYKFEKCVLSSTRIFTSRIVGSKFQGVYWDEGWHVSRSKKNGTYSQYGSLGKNKNKTHHSGMDLIFHYLSLGLGCSRQIDV